MSDQTDQQNDGDVDSQSASSSVSKTVTENSNSPNKQEPATPAVEVAAQQSPAPATGSSLKSLIKKPTKEVQPPKDEALARAMAKMNEARLDPLDIPESDNAAPSVEASISPVISAPSKLSPVGSAPTFSTVSAKSEEPPREESSATMTSDTPIITVSAKTGEPPVAFEAATSTGEVPPVVAQASPTNSSTSNTAVDSTTVSGEAPTFANASSFAEPPMVSDVGTRTGDAPTFAAIGTSTSDAPSVTAETTTNAELPNNGPASFSAVGTSTSDAPTFSAVGTSTSDAPTFSAVGTSTSDAPTFAATEAAAPAKSGDGPTFSAVGTSTTDTPTFAGTGTATDPSMNTEAPSNTAFGTSTGDAPAFSTFGTNTGEAPAFNASGTNSGDTRPFSNTGDAPAFSALGTSTGEAQAFPETGAGETTTVSSQSTTDTSDVPTFVASAPTPTTNAEEFNAKASTSMNDVPTFTPDASIPTFAADPHTSSGEAPPFSPSATATGETPTILGVRSARSGEAQTIVSDPSTSSGDVPISSFGTSPETQSSSSLPRVNPEAIPPSEFELPNAEFDLPGNEEFDLPDSAEFDLPDSAEFDLPADAEFELPDKPAPQSQVSTTPDVPGTAPPATPLTSPTPQAATPPKPAPLSPSTSQAPPVVPRTNAIGLIIEDDAPTTSRTELPSLNPNMAAFGAAPPPPAMTRSESPIDDDTEWGASELGAGADNYESGANKYSLVGQVLFDSYAIVDGIGEGSTCKVYSAMKLDSDRLVAIKTPKTQIGLGFKHRFAEAAMKHGKLKHANIVKSIAYLESPEGQPFFVMEHLAGVTLEEILQTVGRVDDEETLALVLTQIAAALEYAHGLQICHSVLTPRDVLVIESDEQLTVKVMDFQIAEVTEVPKTSKNKKPSSKIYLSPEALRGEESSPQSDIYSLGVIAYRMATGHFPFDGTIDSERDSEQVADPLGKYNPDMKRIHQLNEIVQEALEADPKWRVESAANFKAAVVEWIETVRTEATGTYSYIDMDQVETNESGAPEVIPFETPVAPADPSLTPATTDGSPRDSASQAKYKRKKVRHVVRTTIHNLVALKQKQQHGEETAGRKFADTVAVKGPRRSPIASMVRLTSAIVLGGGLFIGSALFLLFNFDALQSGFGAASRGLSELIPGRKKQEFDIGEKIVMEKPKPAVDGGVKKKPKINTINIGATPPPWAIPGKEGGGFGVNNTSFGVNNSGTKGHRRRIEYRDYVAPGPNN